MTPKIRPFVDADWSPNHWDIGLSLHAWKGYGFGAGIWLGLGPLLLSIGVHDATPGGAG